MTNHLSFLLLCAFSLGFALDAPLPWCYNSTAACGPSHWPSLGYPSCAGREQSPINIDTKSVLVADMGTITRTNVATNDVGLLEDTGHTIEFIFSPKAPRRVLTGGPLGGTLFTLVQFHTHAPSEHSIDGVHFPLEVHFVHTDLNSNRTAVLGLFYEVGADAPAFDAMIAQLQNLPLEHEVNLTFPSPKDFGFADDAEFHFYEGSLTTPPCTENVRWFLATRTYTVSQRQLDAVKNIYSGNNRPVQNLNGRVVAKDTAASVAPAPSDNPSTHRLFVAVLAIAGAGAGVGVLALILAIAAVAVATRRRSSAAPLETQDQHTTRLRGVRAVDSTSEAAQPLLTNEDTF